MFVRTIWLSRATAQAWATGTNQYGRLGLGDSTETDGSLANREVPEMLPSPLDVVQVSVGNFHTVLTDQAGRVRFFLGYIGHCTIVSVLTSPALVRLGQRAGAIQVALASAIQTLANRLRSFPRRRALCVWWPLKLPQSS